ncbi:conserved Plasmodium protein, unknown function [Plasmodium gonderi]|uniref:Uncharacterized protein n=1 Tax=Plasmodium gonderi TaxID=77519 RepID=A0A1Y1JQM2_PLAGO|nr:conserved Plasmodium protein, unknown function [Plasmodium gonderi]GAW83132.1 conserved Plasmodium protein, unknown function [Plasmodium gonderi]
MNNDERDISFNKDTEEVKINNHRDVTMDENTRVLSNINIFPYDNELQNEVNKMIQRNNVYFKMKNQENSSKTVKKKNMKSKKKKLHESAALRKLIKAGKDLENNMLDEISQRRKKNKIKREQKKAKKLEGELKVGNMTVIKDISKMRKCDKKAKNKIYKLSSDVIHKIMKKK